MPLELPKLGYSNVFQVHLRANLLLRNCLRILFQAIAAGLLLAWQSITLAQTPSVRVEAVAPNVLAIHVSTGLITPGKQMPFTLDRQRDQIETRGGQHRWVKRNGEILGALVGRHDNLIFTFDRFSETPLDLKKLDRPEYFTISSVQDPRFHTALSPLSIARKSRPTNMAQVGMWEFRWPMLHSFYLELPTPLQDGATYQIRTNEPGLSPLSYLHIPEQQLSEAVHVNQLGFRPDDPIKLGFLSLWKGDGGGQRYPTGLTFRLIDNNSNQVVLQGPVSLGRRAQESEDPSNGRNYTLADVFSMDFSNIARPGNYRLCVSSIGCSYEFPIRSDSWQTAFTVSARGLYHQRSGIALGPPYTNYRHPRNMHPDDGLRVFHSNAPLLDTGNGLNARGEDKSNFYLLNKLRTPRLIPDAWGGWADAGDWDRRAQHLRVSGLLIELLEMFPDYFESLRLNIPESGNRLPDVLNEALWGIDVFRRLQEADGGIRGGIESADHTRHGEASWQESLPVMAYAPDMWSSFLYAGSAARAANSLKKYDVALAQTYQRSALFAMQWAEQALLKQDYNPLPYQVTDARNLAALELFRLTNDQRWQQLFLKTTVFNQPVAHWTEFRAFDQADAAFLYLRQKPGEPTLRKNMEQALRTMVGESLRIGERTGFRWTKENLGAWIGWGSLSVPQAMPLVRYHYLTQDEQALKGAIAASLFGAGANPLNMVMTTGLGQKFPRNPLHRDHRVSNQPPPPGITVNGPHDVEHMGDAWTLKVLGNALYPPYQKWPSTEFYLDIYSFEPLTEFSVQGSIAPNAYIWGYLAASKRSRGSR